MELIKKLLLRYNITLDELAQITGIDYERLKYILSLDEAEKWETLLLGAILDPYQFYRLVSENEQALDSAMVKRSLAACSQFIHKLEQVVSAAEISYIQNG